MTYFAQAGAMHGWNGMNGFVPAAPITRVLCEVCAIPEVPLEYQEHSRSDGSKFGHWFQRRPWKWAPWFGGPCHTCGKRC